MTPDDFEARLRETVEQMALLFAFSPDDKMKEAIDSFAARILTQWTEVFPNAEPAILQQGVEVIVIEIFKRKHEIEAAGMPPTSTM